MSQIFKREVEKSISTICNKIGFKKKKYNYFKFLDNNTYATLGFGLATHAQKNHIYVNVITGVLFKNIEELRYKLTGYNSMEFMQPTIGIQIGYIMPNNSFKEWDFIENADNTSVFEDLLENIQFYGFAYQKKMKNFDNLFDAIEKRSPGVLNQARDRYLPILYYLKGDKQKGFKSIEDAIERQRKSLDKENILTFSGAKEIITIDGGGSGKVDPEYLKFAENYKKLW
jgi:hypothetical protein